MTWHELGQFKIGPQSVQELHVLNVYSDPEFIKDIATIYPYRDRYVELKRDNKKTPAAEKEYEELSEKLGKIKTSKVYEISKKYSITKEDVHWYLTGYHISYGVYRKQKKPFKYLNITDDNVFVRFDKNITKEDFLQIWVQMRASRDTRNHSKNKLPVYDNLLYAIFKALGRGESFGKIFIQYSLKKLPYYENGAVAILSEEKLKEYYYKHYPKN